MSLHSPRPLRELWLVAAAAAAWLGCPRPTPAIPGTFGGEGDCRQPRRSAVASPHREFMPLCGFDPSARSVKVPRLSEEELGKLPVETADLIREEAGSEGVFCRCNRPEDVADAVDLGAQATELIQREQLLSGCNVLRCPPAQPWKEPARCNFWMIDPRRCAQIGFVHGFAQTAPQHGNDKDWDVYTEVCPTISQGVQNFQGMVVPLALELRSHMKADKPIHDEHKWCRWFPGPVAIAEDTAHPAVEFLEFRPVAGERVSIAGDWMAESSVGGDGHPQMHEVRIGAAVRPNPNCADPRDPRCTNPDVWHILVSGYFSKDTAQQDRLFLSVPMPPATDPSRTKLVCDQPKMTKGGCNGDGVRKPEVDTTSERGKVRITIRRGATGPMFDRYCPGDRAHAPADLCPCDSEAECLTNGITVKVRDADGTERVVVNEQLDRCRLSKSELNGKVQDVEIAFAGDIRCEWRQDPNLWLCECDCEDLAAPGSAFVATVQGCASPGLEAERPEHRRRACRDICGGSVCGTAPACRIGTCRPRASAIPDARLIAYDACEPPPPEPRVSTVADFRVQLIPERSTAELGRVDDRGTFTAQAATHLRGTLWLNDNRVSADRRLEFVRAEGQGDPFTVSTFILLPPFTVTTVFQSIHAFSVTRFPAVLRGDGSYTAPKGQARIGIRAIIDGLPGGLDFLNEGELTGTFRPGPDTFALDGLGRDDEGHAVRLQLVGTIVNHPPIADPGPDRTVECASPTTTPIVLDATASRDPDAGDVMTRVQWFEHETGQGLSTQLAFVAQAKLGANRFNLHVYDRELASDRRTLRVDVVDTAAPDLSLTPETVCLWPPNHEFARFRLGQEVQVVSSDVCDSTPSVRIVSLTADEPAHALGSGSTRPDVASGPTTGCVRAERSGLGTGRTYTLTVEARDASGNAARRDIRIVVPHDQRDHPGCRHAEGVDEIDEDCVQ